MLNMWLAYPPRGANDDNREPTLIPALMTAGYKQQMEALTGENQQLKQQVQELEKSNNKKLSYRESRGGH